MATNSKSVLDRKRKKRRSNKTQYLIITVVALAVILIATLIGVNCFDRYVEFEGITEDTIYVEWGDTFTPPAVKAYGKGHVFNRSGKELEVTMTGEVDTSKVENYSITYTAEYKGKTYEKSVIVAVVDKTAPELTIIGGAEVKLAAGTEYKELGCEATDNYDGDISESVTVTGEVDTKTVGDYTVSYEVKDSSGNVATAERIVHVTEAPPTDKVIYLTFDDGPGCYTDELLEILDKYDVKVTFFVTNQDPDYQDVIKKEAEAGHTVAIHTESHNFGKIYVSEEAYCADMDAMNDIIEAQTGSRSHYFRFPGGSSNTVSRKYNKGIMTQLTESLQNKGYRYYDWNVDSDDAGSARSSEVVIQNVINGCQKNKQSVVLMHDIKKYTVNGVEEIIKWGLENGYTFLPLDDSTPQVHHGVNN